MSKPSKMKKDKVPKITEAQYAEYISSLKDASAPPRENNAENVGNALEEMKRT